MIEKKLILFLAISLIIIFLGATLILITKTSNTTPNIDKHLSTQQISKGSPMHPIKFYDEKSFKEGIEKAKKLKKASNYKITGGIIPHDLDVGFIFSDFYWRLSWQNPSTIILIGPNHYEKGNFKALSSLYSWDTPFGVIEPNREIINALVNRNVIKIDEQVLPNDHAVAGSLPYIKYYMPNVKVVPILLSGTMTKDESETLANNIEEFIKDGAILVAPVDFSHYLSAEQAKEKDELTFQVLKNFDYRQLFSLNNDYLDSPPSIGTFLMVMQKLGSTNMRVLYHTNTGELQNNNTMPTTSFFSIAYFK